jgi:very-short-patch-repair endonuclease
MVGVKKGANFAAVFNKYSRLVADFVVCRRDFSILAVIELDDRHHDHPRRQDADRRKLEVLQAAGIPVIRLNGAAGPAEHELAQLLEPVAS